LLQRRQILKQFRRHDTDFLDSALKGVFGARRRMLYPRNLTHKLPGSLLNLIFARLNSGRLA